MYKRIARIVLALGLLMLVLPTSAAFLNFVEMYNFDEVPIDSLVQIQSAEAGSDEGRDLKVPSAETAAPILNPTNGHYYQLVEVDGPGMNWYEAKNAAAATVHNGIHGHLATVTNPQEETFLVNNFPEIYPEYVWLGASDEASEGDWLWITGEPWAYTNWASGEPNGGAYENCLDYGDYEPGWNDENCGRNIHFYLVEFSLRPITIPIDIKPGSVRNSINCTADKQIIPVAILTTETFDATTVDHITVTFEGASETHVKKKAGIPRRHEADVDKDGDVDLVFHFRFGDTNLTCASTRGTLTGETFAGQPISGSDVIRMIPPYYYTALLNSPGAFKTVSTFGLLGAGLMLGLGLVLGIPTNKKH